MAGFMAKMLVPNLTLVRAMLTLRGATNTSPETKNKHSSKSKRKLWIDMSYYFV
jgi:hypothetical protein